MIDVVLQEKLNFDPQYLLQLARDKSADGRNKLTEEVSDVFQHNLTDQEQKLASEITITLLLQAEINLREKLSKRICRLNNVPLGLALTFSHDEIEVAHHMLTHSPVLSDIDMLYIINEKGTEYWQAISKREKISPVVVNTLIETKDPLTAASLMENKFIRFNRTAMKNLTDIALLAPELNEQLLGRPEVDGEIAMNLYLTVSQELRKGIMENYHFDVLELDKAFTNMVRELSLASQGINDVSQAMMSLASRFQDRGEITSDLLIKTLRRGQLAFFIALLANWLDVNPSIIKILVEKEEGKHLAAACRAAGIIKSEFASIYLLTRSLFSGEKIAKNQDLIDAVKYFDATEHIDANKLLQLWSDKATLDN